MTKTQLKRIALAAEALYLLQGADTATVIDLLSEKDVIKFQLAQKEVAFGWLRQAKFKKVPGSIEEIFRIVSEDEKPKTPPATIPPDKIKKS